MKLHPPTRTFIHREEQKRTRAPVESIPKKCHSPADVPINADSPSRSTKSIFRIIFGGVNAETKSGKQNHNIADDELHVSGKGIMYGLTEELPRRGSVRLQLIE